MQKILLDTNFLLIPAQFKVDIFSEIERICNFSYQIFILDKTIMELENIIKKQKGKDRDAAKLGLKLVSLKKLGIVKTEDGVSTDMSIVNTAESGFIAATQDADLKRLLKAKSIPIITLRQKKYLIFEGKV
ncbi:DNA-binding protein [Candidatus Woesearchaeota archaeon]|nr:DNA-binding protein [Candidatus Woesearchaeota archaeon]